MPPLALRASLLLALVATALLLSVTVGRAGADDSLESLSGRARGKRLEDLTTSTRAFHELEKLIDERRTYPTPRPNARFAPEPNILPLPNRSSGQEQSNSSIDVMAATP